jgi:hypothetical protein
MPKIKPIVAGTPEDLADALGLPHAAAEEWQFLFPSSFCVSPPQVPAKPWSWRKSLNIDAAERKWPSASSSLTWIVGEVSSVGKTRTSIALAKKEILALHSLSIAIQASAWF